jgi:hypothetical protein
VISFFSYNAAIGKTTFFVANQAKIESMPAEMTANLEAEIKATKEENASMALQVKAKAAGTLVNHGHDMCGQRAYRTGQTESDSN